MATKKSTGLQRQIEFLEEKVQGKKFDYGIVVANAFLQGMRKIGYKNTAYALFENIDNAIQAEANNIHIIFDWDKDQSKNKEPQRIAIIDDGHGMDPRMLRISVLWGGSDRINNRDGLGRFGYGLPSSCVSIGEKFTVYSKIETSQNWYHVPMDIQEIGNNNPLYFNIQTGRVEAPEAKASEVPDFVAKYIKAKKIKLDSGTIVLIDKIDTLSQKLFSKLKEFLITESGICYRNYLKRINIFIDEVNIEPVDPLFTTEGAKYYDEDFERAEAYPIMEVPVKDKGSIKVRFSYMSPTFLRVPEDKMKTNGKNNFRFDIRKENNGIIVLRAGRQIDVVNAKSPFVFQNYDRYIGIEMDFPPSMDDSFSITTSKQQIVIEQKIWDILRDAGFDGALKELRKRYSKEAIEHGNKVKHLKGLTEEEKTSYVESIMTEAAQEFETDEEVKPRHIKDEAERELKTEIEKRVARELPKSGVEENILRQKIEADLESEIQERPYKLDYIDEEEGPFFRPKQMGGQIVIYINKAHKFYTDLYNSQDTSQFTRNALALLLFSIGHAELRAKEEKKKWYSQERVEWAQRLDITLEKLVSKSVANNKNSTPIDAIVFDEEIEAMESKI